MKKHDDSSILSRLPHGDGMTVPEGYFSHFAERMEQSLPQRDDLAPAVLLPKRSFWQQVRPYIYMAAMFAGVWCMLKMFSLLTANTPLPLDTNPVIAEAFSNDTFVSDYVLSDLSQWDIYDDMMADGIDPDSLGLDLDGDFILP